MRKTWIHDINASPEGKGEGKTRVNLGEGCRGCTPPPRDDLRFSNTTGILQKKEKLCGLLVLKQGKSRVHPLLKQILDPPLFAHGGGKEFKTFRWISANY